MLHDARSVANKLIHLAHKADRDITPMQVMKLTYYCHAWMLGLYGQPLIEQPVEAWQYGPVVPDVYHSLRRYGREPVNRPIERVTGEDFSDLELNLIQQVSEKYGRFTGLQLSQLTHAPGTPWDQVWKQWGQNAIIPDPTIDLYYKKLVEEAEASA